MRRASRTTLPISSGSRSRASITSRASATATPACGPTESRRSRSRRTCAISSPPASTTAWPCGHAAVSCAAPASASTTPSSGKARRSPTAGRATPASTQARTGRRAYRPGSRRRSLPRRIDAGWAGWAAGARRPDLLLLRLDLLLRAHADDACLSAVARVPGVVVEHRAGARVDEAAHARGTRRLATLLDRGHALVQRRVGNALDRRRPGVDEGTRLALDAPVDRRAVQVDDERRRADERAQKQPAVGVVDEAQVGVGVVHGRVAPLRVMTDVQRVIRA